MIHIFINMYILFSVCDILISVRGGVREGRGWEDRSGEDGGREIEE